MCVSVQRKKTKEIKTSSFALDDDDAVAEGPPTEARELFAALCEDVTTKAVASFGLTNGATCFPV